MRAMAAKGHGFNPRGLGMVAAIDLGSGGYAGSLGWQVASAARQRGVYLRPLGDTIYLTPPLNIPIATLAELLDALEDAVSEIGVVRAAAP